MNEETPPAPAETKLSAGATTLLFVTVLVIATSGLVYELLAGTVASYVLGDSVTQFSTTIGTYLFAMGLGSWLSRFVQGDVARRFLEVELAAALVGGGSAPLLFLGFARAEAFEVLLYGLIVVIGTLVGLEIPLLMRILKERLAFEELVSKVLTFDYVGALFGSVLFALLFVPVFGLTRTSLFFGVLNAGVAVVGTYALRPLLDRGTIVRTRALAALVAALLVFGFVHADELTNWAEQDLYEDPIVFATQSPYQRIVVTQARERTSLFLNGNLQFSSEDEHRYHEALVHPVMSAARRRERVLILGGGDGLALREVFRHPEVREVTLVDLDPAMTETAGRLFGELAEHAFDDPRLTLVHDDALVWLDERPADAPSFDVVIVDFPDPNHFALGKLYTSRFYRLAQRAMADDGAMVVQSTSPLFARRSFWCIDATMRASGLHTAPYHATVPSFGAWGFVLARKARFEPPERLESGLEGRLRFLTNALLPSLFVFPADMAPLDVEPNRLNDQTLVRYYEAETRRLER